MSLTNDWMDLLTVDRDDIGRELDRIRSHGNTGRPPGADGFIAKLERLLNIRIRPKRPGRGRKGDL